MKVLQINTYCGYGSTGKIAVDIANSLDVNDECFIAYGYFDTNYTNHYNLLKYRSSLVYKIKLLYNRLRGTTGYTNSKRTKDFCRWIDKYNPDVIHLHNLHGDYLNIKILFEYLKKRNYPIVWTFHDCWPFTGRCAYFDYNGCTKWQEGCYSCQFKNVFPISYIFDTSKEEWIKKRALFQGLNNLTIVTPSLWLANLVSKSFLGDYPIKIINNGIDLTNFQHREYVDDIIKKYNLHNKKVILGVAGSWSYRKGLNYFIELSKILPDNLQIVLIGLSDSQLSGLPHNIIGIKHTSSVIELSKWYSLSAVYANPTLDDNYPTTNLEAQACGTPVITFNTGGSPESVQFGKIVYEKDVDALKDAIMEVLSYDKIGKINYDVLSKKSLAQRYIQLYSNVINITKGE